MTDELPTAPLDVALSLVEAGLKGQLTGLESGNGLAALEDVKIHVHQKDLTIARLQQQLIVVLDVLIERGVVLAQDDTEYRAEWLKLTGREWWRQ